MGSVCKVIENKTFLAICPQQSFGRMFTAALFCVPLCFLDLCNGCLRFHLQRSQCRNQQQVDAVKLKCRLRNQRRSRLSAQVSVPDESSRASLGVSVSDSETDEHRKLGRHGRVSMTRENAPGLARVPLSPIVLFCREYPSLRVSPRNISCCRRQYQSLSNTVGP